MMQLLRNDVIAYDISGYSVSTLVYVETQRLEY
jgi:hypothetical protein